MEKYDVIVIGAGHAGIEAANAASKLNCSVLFLTIDIDDIGKLSCNPAIGGVSKGHLVREVDALGGLIGKIADKTSLGYRILNRSKGKAVWSTRAQIDMFSYPKIARDFIESKNNIKILQVQVEEIIVKNKKVCGVRTNFGQEFRGKTVVVCAGTFLNSKIHIGLNSFPGGRLYEISSDKLFFNIKKLGFKTKYFKTGTCARLDKRTIDFSKMVKQVPDKDVVGFSSSTNKISKQSLSCYITYTNKNTHKIILRNLKYSPLYSGKIKATGVRYCPSLEDKVVKFFDRDRHQVFIEPQGKDSIEVYPNGVSTSLPFSVQEDFIRTIKGLENVSILRPGYGIEYGIIDAKTLFATFESRNVGGLFFAGQVNGTTGYEEAAAQGLIAGINSALFVKKEKPFILSRNIAYIGVMADDLTSKGVDEPYRMFTSRSEFRLSLRESNADIRLASCGYKLGLLSKDEYKRSLYKQELIAKSIAELRTTRKVFGGKNMSLFDRLKNPKVDFKTIEKCLGKKIKNLNVEREVEIIARYEGFLRRELAWHKELKNLDKIKIPNIDYALVNSLSREVKEKLQKFKPATLKQALDISGITPAAILNVYNHIKSLKKENKMRRKHSKL